ARNQMFDVFVVLRNDISQPIGSYAPAPIRFSYYWADKISQEYAVLDGIRTEIIPSLGANSENIYKVKVKSLDSVGIFQLVISLVQENVRWFDSIGKKQKIVKMIQVTH
ncbi:unnamed protein product, partial [marine sediment metagenome]